MIGECTGKVRSTPTPKLTFRTVKVSRLPLPLRRITMPWNTWTRSRLPSTTRTCTLRVSPGAKSGMSSRSWVRSTRSVAFIGNSGIEEPGMLLGVPGVREFAEQRLVGGTRAAGEQIGPATQCGPQCARPPPALHPGVVAAREHLGDRMPAVLGRTGVLRVLEQAGSERLVGARGLVAHHPRHEPGDCVDHHRSRRLSAGEHEVAHRELAVAEV